jgi:transposase-like protein
LRTDELYVKIKGDMEYMYAIIDDETRFWIAQQVAHTKNSADITSLLQKGKKIAKIQPKTFTSDGAGNFHDAYMKELHTLRNPKTTR